MILFLSSLPVLGQNDHWCATTEEKNASEINNEQLINTLDAGLYKIEKDYSDGYKEEIIISKSDN